MFAWELGVQVPGLASHRSWGRVLGGSGPGRRWRTLKAVLKVTRSTAVMTILVMGQRPSLEAEWVTRAFPSGGRVTLGRSFPLLRPWFSPVGWHKGAARTNVANAPQMLSLMPGTWGPPVLLCWIVWFFLCLWEL